MAQVPALPVGAERRVQILVDPQQVTGWIEARAEFTQPQPECFTTNQATAAHHVHLLAWDAPGEDRTSVLRFLMELWDFNVDPRMAIVPAIEIPAGLPWEFTAPITDANVGDVLRFELPPNAPAGMRMHPYSGLMSWTPLSSQVGTYTLTITGLDLAGRTGFRQIQITVTPSPNRPPSITSAAPLAVAVAQLYRYAVLATDPNGDALSYNLTAAPAGMTIDAATGVIEWTPSAEQVGTHTATVQVSDPAGLTAVQTWNLDVRAQLNRPPVITSVPPMQGRQNVTYEYLASATDPDGQPLTWSVVVVPPNIGISQYSVTNSGRMQARTASHGQQTFRLRASDGQLWAEQEWTVQFVPEVQARQVQIQLPGGVFVAPGSSFTAQVLSTGFSGAVHTILTLDGQPVSLNAQGLATLDAGTPGTRTLRASVSDASGTVTETVGVHVSDPADTQPPVVELPVDWSGRVITAPVPVRARVEDDRLAYWRLLLSEHGGPTLELLRGSGTGADLPLGTFDPTVLENGTYQLIVEAVDTSGRSTLSGAEVLLDGNMKLGQFSLSFEDIQVPVAGIPVTLTRTYDTRLRNRNLDFGYGWTVDYQSVRIRESRTLGKSWRNDRPSGSFQNCIRANGVPMVSVTLPDGRTETFRPKLSRECQLVVLYPVELQFEPAGIDHGYTLEQLDYSLVEWRGDGLYEPGFQAPVDPRIYKLTAPDGRVYVIDQEFGIRTVSDLNGHTLTYSRAGVVHSSGVKLDFVRDAQGRITEVIQPDGQRYQYRYDNQGDLVQMIDPVNGVHVPTRFEYLRGQHYLTRLTGPHGYSTRNEYDEDGRLIKTIDGAGREIVFDRVIEDRIERVRNRLGHTTIYQYDERGNVLSERNHLGETILRTYDADDNVLTETNPLNQTVTRTYDNYRNTLTETNQLGENATMTYDARLNLASTRNALGHTQSVSYRYRDNRLNYIEDAMGQRTSMVYLHDASGLPDAMEDALGYRTWWTYDSKGNKLTETDPTGAVTRWTYDSMSRVLTETRSRTDANGQVQELLTAYAYDANGRVVRTVAPDGSVSERTYTPTGKVKEDIDHLGRHTRYFYDALDQLFQTTYPDNTYERITFDAEGRELSRRDRLGRVTEMRYDAAGRLLETIHPDSTPATLNDNPRTRNEYNAAGRMTASIDERGQRTRYEYDEAGRQIAVINALQQRTETVYDAAGRRIAVMDADDHITRFEYDAAGRLLRTVHPDDTPADDADNPVSAMVYNALGQKIAAIDPVGRRTSFEYDAAGRLQAVVDALNQRTEYGYDAQGNRITQKDARGNVTKFGFDVQNRQISRELPLGQRESMRYDGQGRLSDKTDFNGRTTAYQYDVNDRVSQILHADGRLTLLEYNATGQRTRSEQRYPGGAVEITTWAYDVRHRLQEVVYTDGSFVRYQYDAAGNRTRVITPSATVDYTFDVLNRLDTVVAPEGTHRYGYDPVGNRASETRPNGVTTSYTYNPCNQLTRMQHATAAGTVLLSLSYTLDASGMRHAITELAGPSETALELRTTRNYTYDPLLRLTAETVSCGAGNGLCAPRSTTWTYDAVGNRQLQTENRGGSVATTAYVYDANDRLLSSVLAGVPVNGDPVGTTTNRYDANGNLIESIAPASEGNKRTLYGWNSDDKLLSAVITESVDGVSTSTESRYTYTADGIRRTQTARFGAGDATTIQYLIDPNQAYAQVLEETIRPATQGGAGHLVVRYSYGDDLLAQVRTGVETPNVDAGAGLPTVSASTNFYHYDGLGTTRLLTDAAGAVTDQYGFEAFGEKDQAASAGSTPNNYLYTGEQYDPNLGFYYLRARYMNPADGRFAAMDRYSGRIFDPRSLHRYQYAHLAPTQFIDPTGHYTAAFGRAVEEYVCDVYIATVQPMTACGVNQHYGSGASYWKPDIFNYKDRVLAEIKPLSASGISAGIAQIAAYSAAFAPMGFHREEFWAPPPASINGNVTYFFNAEGVIFYTTYLKERQALLGIPLKDLGPSHSHLMRNWGGGIKSAAANGGDYAATVGRVVMVGAAIGATMRAAQLMMQFTLTFI